MSKHITQVVREGVVVFHTRSAVGIAFPADGAKFGEFQHDGRGLADPSRPNVGGYEAEVVEIPVQAEVGEEVILPGTRANLTIDLISP